MEYKCPYYKCVQLNKYLETAHPVCSLNGNFLSENDRKPSCKNNILFCIYKTDTRVKEVVKRMKDELMREEEKIRRNLEDLTNAFGEPYR